MPNGKFYNAVFNLTGALGPNIQQATGITELYIGAINQKYDLIIVSNGTAVPPITYVSMSQYSSNPSLAHFWPDNAFRRYNNGNMMVVGLNDNYINGLIDNRLSMIGTAEAGVY
jgi:hypothetical protein